MARNYEMTDEDMQEVKRIVEEQYSGYVEKSPLPVLKRKTSKSKSTKSKSNENSEVKEKSKPTKSKKTAIEIEEERPYEEYAAEVEERKKKKTTKKAKKGVAKSGDTSDLSGGETSADEEISGKETIETEAEEPVKEKQKEVKEKKDKPSIVKPKIPKISSKKSVKKATAGLMFSPSESEASDVRSISSENNWKNILDGLLPDISAKNKTLLYEKFNDMNDLTYVLNSIDLIYSYPDDKDEAIRIVLKSADEDELMKHHPIIKQLADAQAVEFRALTYKPEISRGGFKCRKCGSDKTISQELQTRAADEPMTTFITCTVCGNKWRN